MSEIKRRRPSPAVVVATLALVAAVAGTAVAESGPTATTSAGKTAKKALKKAKKANKKAKKANGRAKQAQSSADDAQATADDAQSAADDAQATADQAIPLTAVVAADGAVTRGNGVTSTNAKLGGSGLYTVEFDRNVSDCVWVAQIGNGDSTPTIYGEMSTFLAGDADAIFVQTASSGGVLADRPFHLIVHC